MEVEDEEVMLAPVVDDSPSAAFSACPECGTMKIMVPNLQLKFSTCCGRCMCVGCINSRFSGKSAKMWQCNLCNENLRPGDWDVLPLEEQRFKTEIRHRQEGIKSHVLSLERADFDTNRAYDDYQEWCAEQIYQLTYGGKAAAEAAAGEMRRYARENQARIDSSRTRKRAEARELERKGLLAAAGYDERAAVLKQMQQAAQAMGGGMQLNFTLPQPLDDPSTATGSAQLEDARIAAIANPKQRASEQAKAESKRREAGGFKREDDLKRSRQDALEGLFM